MAIFKRQKKDKKPAKEEEKKTEKKEETGKKMEKKEEKETETKKEEKPQPAGGSALLMRQAWITEKATDLSALGKYIFIVDKKANKPETKKAIESIYGVKVERVNIINVKSKEKRLGRSLGRTSAFKKAVVSLKPGEKIDITPT